jgi:hypothetical protein
VGFYRVAPHAVFLRLGLQLAEKLYFLAGRSFSSAITCLAIIGLQSPEEMSLLFSIVFTQTRMAGSPANTHANPLAAKC